MPCLLSLWLLGPTPAAPTRVPKGHRRLAVADQPGWVLCSRGGSGSSVPRQTVTWREVSGTGHGG